MISSELKRLPAVGRVLADFAKSSMPRDTSTTRQEFDTHVKGSSDDDSLAISIATASFITKSHGPDFDDEPTSCADMSSVVSLRQARTRAVQVSRHDH